MTLALLLIACGGMPSEGKLAAEQLNAALVRRDVAEVSAAARAADAFRGQDPALDRALGDALANVLMRPEQGLPLLKANPAPDDAAWRTALRGAAVRLGDQAEMNAAWAATGGREISFLHAIAETATARARRDPAFDLSQLDRVNADCALLVTRPMLGRAALDAPARASLLDAVRALGATDLVLARPALPTDADPLAGAPFLVATDLDGDPREARIRQALVLGADEVRRRPAGGRVWTLALRRMDDAGGRVLAGEFSASNARDRRDRWQ